MSTNHNEWSVVIYDDKIKRLIKTFKSLEVVAFNNDIKKLAGEVYFKMVDDSVYIKRARSTFNTGGRYFKEVLILDGINLRVYVKSLMEITLNEYIDENVILGNFI